MQINKLLAQPDDKLVEIIRKDDLEKFRSYIEDNNEKIETNRTHITTLDYCFAEKKVSKKITKYILDNYPEIVRIESFEDIASVILQKMRYQHNITENIFLNKCLRKIIKDNLKFYQDENTLGYSRSKNHNLLEIALIYNDEKTFKYLISKGFNINYINPVTGDNLLHAACHHPKNKNIIKYLLKNKKFIHNLNMPNNVGDTPFLIANKQTDIDFINYLVTKGANVSVVNKNNCNALHAFCSGVSPSNIWRSVSYNIKQAKKILKYIDLLINSGISINSVDSENNNAILHLSQSNNNENKTFILKKLYECGINLEQKNNDGNTVLNYLIHRHRLKELHFILNKWQGDYNTKNKEGIAPIMSLFYEKNSLFPKIISAENYKKNVRVSLVAYGEKLSQYYATYNTHSTESIFSYLVKRGFNKPHDIPSEINIFENYFKENNNSVFSKPFENINFSNIIMLKHMISDLNICVDISNNNIVHQIIKNSQNKDDIYKKIIWAIENDLNILHCNSKGISAISLLNDPVKEHEFTEMYIQRQKKLLNNFVSEKTPVKSARTRL